MGLREIYNAVAINTIHFMRIASLSFNTIKTERKSTEIEDDWCRWLEREMHFPIPFRLDNIRQDKLIDKKLVNW